MKKILYMVGLSLVVLALLFSSIGCEGPVGPQGLEGVQGVAGATGPQGLQGVKGDTGEPGAPIFWMGTAASAPKSWRVLNYAYYNSTQKTSYIWDGNSWEILAKDGAAGYSGATGATGATGAAGAAGAAGATGSQGLVGQIVATSSVFSSISSGYKNATPVDSVTLGGGDWIIVATGAIEVTYDTTALNVGLRTDYGGTTVMLAKSNIAPSKYVGRLGFAVVGTLSVATGDSAVVDLVHYGGGGLPPFEHNIVAIGGTAP